MVDFKRKKRPEEFFVTLESVESYCDDLGVHPLLEDGTPDMDDVVKYSQINDKEFEKLMSEEDLKKWRKIRQIFGVYV